MEPEYIELNESEIRFGFKGTLRDLMRDVWLSGQNSNKDDDFEDSEWAKIEFDRISIRE